jgi:hypothetical protein
MKCSECSRPAVVLMMVPWVHVETRVTGADETPFCQRHEPTAEDWSRRYIEEASSIDSMVFNPLVYEKPS